MLSSYIKKGRCIVVAPSFWPRPVVKGKRYPPLRDESIAYWVVEGENAGLTGSYHLN